MSEGTKLALWLVEGERARQDAKWGEQNHDLTVWLTVLMEEVGEAAQATLRLRAGEGSPDHDERPVHDKAQAVRDELVQVAAVAVAAVEYLDRGMRPSEPEAVR